MSRDSAKPRRIVLLGPPASGKGTQGRRLADSFGLGYLSTGALLRQHVDNATALGRLAAPILARGEYLPDALMCEILADWLDGQPRGWVLDGFPRSLPQAEFLDEWMAARERRIDSVVLLEAPFEELVERIRGRVECPECRWSGQRAQTLEGGLCPVCGVPAATREDDNEERFAIRHREYLRLTTPVIDHYRELDLLARCDVTAGPDEVSENILNLLLSMPAR